MPLSTDDFILTHMVTAGVVDPEPVAIAVRAIIRASPCGDTPDHSDIEIDIGGVATTLTIATPWADLVPVSRS